MIELLENEEKMDAEEISREMDEYTTSYMKNFSYKTVFVASEKRKPIILMMVFIRLWMWKMMRMMYGIRNS